MGRGESKELLVPFVEGDGRASRGQRGEKPWARGKGQEQAREMRKLTQEFGERHAGEGDQ